MVKIIEVNNQNKITIVDEVSKILRRGGIFAFPTDTVYGLGVDAGNNKAIEKLYKLKSRSQKKPLIILIDNKDELAKLAKNIPPYIDKVIEAFWPGPLTIILEKSSFLSKKVTAGLETIGVRMPDQDFLRSIIRTSGIWLASTSANVSSYKDALTVNDVAISFPEEIDLIIDGGPAKIGLPSTIVDFTGSEPLLLREGTIKLVDIKRVISGDNI